MKKKLFAFLFLLMSCREYENRTLVINPIEFTATNITLSDIADDIRYISLDSSIPFIKPVTYRITNEAIYLPVKDYGILKYNLNGNFITKIGQIGRGPDEYLQGLYFDIDEENGRVYVVNENKIKVYDSSGKYLRDISLNDSMNKRISYFSGLEVLNSNLFIPDYLTAGYSVYNWIIVDSVGKVLQTKRNCLEPFEVNWAGPGNTSKTRDGLLYFNQFNDTISNISGDRLPESRYLFAQGDFRRKPGRIEFSSISGLQDFFFNIFKPINLIDSKDYLFLEFTYQDKWAYAVYDKASDKKFLSYVDDLNSQTRVKTKSALINDLDGGPDLEVISFLSEDGEEYLISFVDALEFKKKLMIDKNSNSKSLFLKNLEDAGISPVSLAETDNPILIMARLKH